jgi:transposase
VHEISKKNTDYFSCPDNYKVLTDEIKSKTFNSVEDLNALVQKMNTQMTGGDSTEKVLGISYNKQAIYLYIKCAFRQCRYEHWFTYTNKDKKLTNIRLHRTINQNHSLSAHQAGARKENPFTL